MPATEEREETDTTINRRERNDTDPSARDAIVREVVRMRMAGIRPVEIARRLGLHRAQVHRMVLRAARSRTEVAETVRDLDVKVYSEEEWEAKLRREKAEALSDEFSLPAPSSGDLVHGQCMDLLDALDLTDREREAVRHRLEGRTLEESGELLGVSAACVHLALAGLRRRLPESLAGMEALMIPGRVPHYGWQEVYLDSLRSRPTGEI